MGVCVCVCVASIASFKRVFEDDYLVVVRPRHGGRGLGGKFNDAGEIDGGTLVDEQLGTAVDLRDGLCKHKLWFKLIAVKGIVIK